MLRMLGSIERVAARMRAGGPVCEGTFVKAFGFINDFVCHGHHAKERRLLRTLKARGVWPLGRLLEGHRDSLDFAAAMVRSLPGAARGDDSARRMLAENAKALAGYMRAHIRREEECVFPAAGRALDARDDGDVCRAYAEIDRDSCGSAAAMVEECERSVARALACAAEGAADASA
jgi:hemerythrin-like domain-containing protein